MKRVLITGQNSYIGNSFEKWVHVRNGADDAAEEIQATKVSLRSLDWQAKSWEGYDSVLHVAGLAHVDVAHADEATRQKYYEVNRDLTIAAACKAKRDGVRQFIYMSSIIIYGDSAPIGQEKVITETTKPSPANFYGDSKWQAEKGILPLQDEKFRVVIVRPPMVYGEGSKGNFPKLVQLAGKVSIFPQIGNHRSMIYIDNLCELLRLIVLRDGTGIYYPQNPEQLSTSELYRMIGKSLGRKIHLVKGLTPLLKAGSHITGYVDKMFGSLTYDQSLSRQELGYCLYHTEESIGKTISSR